MPEPDFDQIADTIIRALRDEPLPAPKSYRVAVIEQLRLIWNARGAADVAAVEQISPFPLSPTRDAIAKVDR